jgi:hypothetical protein
MPTHKDLFYPDLDDDPERREGQVFSDPGHGRRRRKRHTRARALLAAVLVVVFAGLEVLLTRTDGRQGPGLSDQALRASPVPTRHHAAGRLLGSENTRAAAQRTAPDALNGPATLEHQKVLAIGYSVPRSGRAPHLLAFGHSGGVVIDSLSPMPVTVSVSAGHGRAIRYWRTLSPGRGQQATLITGTSYGYCFSQARGGGYAPTRGCGTLTVHQYLNGVRLPDGAAVPQAVTFVRS